MRLPASRSVVRLCKMWCVTITSLYRNKGIDYNETFTPVTKFNSIQLLLALAARYDWEIHQMDVKSAFLNGELDEEIYMWPPPSYKATPNTVWWLKKALYSLKQVSREWYKTFSSKLKTLGFTCIQADHCVFYKNIDGHDLIIMVYVDDNLILSDSLDLVNKTKKELSSCFEMTDLGDVNWILNMEVTCKPPKTNHLTFAITIHREHTRMAWHGWL